MSMYGYLEVYQSLFDFEITRVECSLEPQLDGNVPSDMKFAEGSLFVFLFFFFLLFFFVLFFCCFFFFFFFFFCFCFLFLVWFVCLFLLFAIV